MASKVFIITGASKGLGAAITRYLLSQSHKVVLAARSAEPLEGFKTAHPGQVEYVAGDMTSSEMPDKLTSLAVKSFGKIDGLVVNHGLLVSSRLEKTSIDTFKNLYDVNVFSCLAMVQAALGELRKTKGCVVWISSGAALKPYAGWSAYGSSKAVLNSLSSNLAFEDKDITSITVAPGRVDTDMQVQIRSSGQESMDKAQWDTFQDAFEQGKLLKPEQPGNVIAKFVANPQRDLSGQNLNWNSPELASYQE
ncbi:NAD(P)-binding domain-containing protein [Pochonia chlamydosporia 170]|uniref:NAD(P)-binding domain-containing protein n=1 Tax=Pochonia chlamydosporia 170 TaxID=1380566 RepID=A0A179F3B8_METCM|nr:NAD(P)-binding domain-containing protein [Pochonia chlamydosporia 170]OAQ59912.1 NAD(P)-binding domain-containing protein [Pochonia chlamydosporia 170]